MTALITLAAAAAIVLIPHAPLLLISLGVNVFATMLMVPSLAFLLLLANDRAIMGPLANGRRGNLAGGAVCAAVALLGLVYAVVSTHG